MVNCCDLTGLPIGFHWLTGNNTLANEPEEAALELHNGYDTLLLKYDVGVGVNYSGWVANREDVSALRRYATELTALDPEFWTSGEQLAYC